jgi:transposase-like protein
VYRAVDQHGQVIDVFVSRRRDIASARRFFTTALAAYRSPVEVITDRAPALANVIDDLIPAMFHNTSHYELGVEAASAFQLATAFDKLRLAI